MKVSPGGSYGVLALVLEMALGGSVRELGKIGMFLHPHCPRVHKSSKYLFTISLLPILYVCENVILMSQRKWVRPQQRVNTMTVNDGNGTRRGINLSDSFHWCWAKQ